MTKKNNNFETNIEVLDSILLDLESGGLSLADALKKFEEGIGLYSSCLEILESVNGKVSILKSNIDTGDLIEIPLNPEEY